MRWGVRTARPGPGRPGATGRRRGGGAEVGDRQGAVAGRSSRWLSAPAGPGRPGWPDRRRAADRREPRHDGGGTGVRRHGGLDGRASPAAPGRRRRGRLVRRRPEPRGRRRRSERPDRDRRPEPRRHRRGGQRGRPRPTGRRPTGVARRRRAASATDHGEAGQHPGRPARHPPQRTGERDRKHVPTLPLVPSGRIDAGRVGCRRAGGSDQRGRSSRTVDRRPAQRSAYADRRTVSGSPLRCRGRTGAQGEQRVDHRPVVRFGDDPHGSGMEAEHEQRGDPPQPGQRGQPIRQASDRSATTGRCGASHAGLAIDGRLPNMQVSSVDLAGRPRERVQRRAAVPAPPRPGTLPATVGTRHLGDGGAWVCSGCLVS